MHTITVRRRLGHPWTDLFALVLDIERYPQFVPGCTRVRMIARNEPQDGVVEIISRMTAGVLPLQISYTNRTLANRAARRISVDSTDGPLQFLHVLWRFEPLDAQHCDISFSASYSFRNPVLGRLAGAAFETLFSQIADAFARRADQQSHLRMPAA